MARNGSGTYSPTSGSWSTGAVNGALATVADWQALLADLSAALTQSVSKDGQTPITGNLNMGGNKLTNMAAGSGAGQSLLWEQLFSQGVEADLASAATTDIGAQNTNFLRLTGTSTITSFGTNYNGPRFIRFAAALTLTNSATLILPGASDITTVAGDTLIAIPKATSGTADGWQVVAYQRTSSLQPVTSGTATVPLTNVNVTLTGSQAAYPVITFTGTLTGNVNVIFPNDVKSYRILNNTTGAFTVTCKTAAGSGTVVAAGSSDIFCDGTNITTTSISSAQITSKIQPILATVASNALTITLNPTTLDFRSTTLPSGAVSTVTLGSAVTVIVPPLATLGTVSATQSRLAVLAINNAGTIEAAVVNIAGGNDLSETGLISTTAISGSATAANVFYSTTARTSVAYRVVGYVESTQATAGTWATAPSTVQGQGGLVIPGSLIKSGTAVASTSGTSIDFTSIPAWVKRITVMFNGVSLSGTSNYLVQLGAGSVTTSGYSSAGGVYVAGTTATLASTAGFVMRNNAAASNVISAIMNIVLVSSNTWLSTHTYGDVPSAATGSGGGNIALGGTLDRIRITTVNGTDTFDAGSVNILWE